MNDRIFKSMMFGLFILSVGCADALDTEGETQSQSFDVAIAGAYTPSAQALEASANYKITYNENNPWTGSCPEKFFTDEAKELKQHLISRFSKISSVGGYNCRRNTANTSQMSVHGTGRALDIMLPTTDGSVDGPADNTVGDEIANYLIQNAEQLGIQYLIWDRWQFSPGRTGASRSRAYNSPGSDDHNNHIHVEILPFAACTGTIDISLEWTATTDLDIHVVPPGGREISPDIADTTTSAGGRLVRDSCYKEGCYDEEKDHKEVVQWANSELPEGNFRVWAENWSGNAAAEFEVKFVYPNGDVRRVPGNISAEKRGASEVFEFELTKDDLQCAPGTGSRTMNATDPNNPNGTNGTNGTDGTNGTTGKYGAPTPANGGLVNANVGGCSSATGISIHPMYLLLFGFFAFRRRKK